MGQKLTIRCGCPYPITLFSPRCACSFELKIGRKSVLLLSNPESNQDFQNQNLT